MRSGVVKFAPVASEVPPVLASNQVSTPAEVTALSVSVPLPQRLPGVTDEITGSGFIVATTSVRGDVQPFAVAST